MGKICVNSCRIFITLIAVIALTSNATPAFGQLCRAVDGSYLMHSIPCYAGDYWTLIAWLSVGQGPYCDATSGYQAVIRDACTGQYWRCDGSLESGRRYTGSKQMIAWSWEPQFYQVYWLVTHQEVRLEWCSCQDGDPNKTCYYEVRSQLTTTEGWEYGQCCWR